MLPLSMHSGPALGRVGHAPLRRRKVCCIIKEYAPYSAALSEKLPDPVSTGEAVETTYQEGDPIRVLGVVGEIGDNLIGLNNGVDCYMIPETLDDADADKVRDLGWLKSGDVVDISGMVCNTAPLTLKYCGVPLLIP